MADSLERYQKLGLKQSLNRIYQYPLACKELSFILRFAYSKFPKNLQSLIFHDTLTAFQLLPGMQTQTAVSAANLLLQGAEAALPKQKRAQAVIEFKHAMIAHKRLCKAANDGEGVAHLPQDVLVHVFSFLDFRSLVSAALVCRSWNAASSDNHLWQLQHTVLFDNSDNHHNSKLLEIGVVENRKFCAQEAFLAKVGIDWRTGFKRAYRGILSKKFVTSSRGCCKKCSTILWLSDMTNENCEVKCKKHQIVPFSSQQIVEYLNGGSLASPISSDSDSDSDEGSSASKLWAYRRQSNKLSLQPNVPVNLWGFFMF